MSKPPSSNTGAPNTAPLKNQCLIDWFGFTLPFEDPYEVADLMGLRRGLFTESDRGGMGYKSALRFGRITIYFNGSADMGCHCEMSGQGCREYEENGRDWIQLIAFIQLKQGHLSRLDLAIDTVDETLSIETLEHYYASNRVRTLFRRSGLITSDLLTSDGPVKSGFTRYFGHVTSRTVFRIYDKALQLGCDSPWIRFELQLRDERANAAADLILRRHDLGSVATGIINNNLSFIELDDSNKSRCSLAVWWSTWLCTTEKLKLTKKKALRLIEEVQGYMKKQYAPTLAMLKKALGVSGFSDFMHEVLSDGYSRMKQKHDDIIIASRLVCEYPF